MSADVHYVQCYQYQKPYAVKHDQTVKSSTDRTFSIWHEMPLQITLTTQNANKNMHVSQLFQVVPKLIKWTD
jgi:hypothetical protein